MRIQVKCNKFEPTEDGLVLYVNEEDLREALKPKMNKISAWFAK